MIFKTIITAITDKISRIRMSNKRTMRHQYLINKYNERSITNRYFS